LRLCLAAALFSATLLAADVTGIWTGQVPGRDGGVQDLSFRFVQTGDKLTGKMYGDNASTPIVDAKITGDQITFSVRSELNGQINRVIYTGTVSGNEIHLRREREGGRNGAANQNAAMVLKKLS
jgi:hypothetical protein